MITLYDITSRLTPRSWSPNVWKARTFLNYKRIPYKTVWLSYPDIEPVLKMQRAVPTSVLPDGSGKPWYTLPAIIDPQVSYPKRPKVVTGSLDIIKYLERKYPDRRPVRKLQDEIDFPAYFWETAGKHLRPVMVPLAIDILDERSKLYFRETRERWYGKRLEEFCPEGPARDAQWETIGKGFEEVAARFDKINGPNVKFVAEGKEATHADLFAVSFLAWIISVAPEEGWNQRVRHWSDGRWGRLWDRAEQDEWTIVR